MRQTLTCILLLLNITSYSQSKELVKRIELSHMLRRLQYEKKYDSIIAVAGKLPFRDSVYLYGTEAFVAQAYLEKGDTANAMKFLAKAIENRDIKELGNLKYGYGKYKLDSNKDYKYIVTNFDKLHRKYDQHLNLSMLQDCLEIYYTDQRMRWLWMGARDTLTQRIADSLQYKSDLMNVEAMKQVFRRYGRYPGISDVGAAFTSNFIHIVAHFASELDRDTLYAYLQTATLKGDIPNWYGPFILDKTEFYAGHPLIYGEFGNANNYKDGSYYYSDIRDIESVDKRRADFLLPPLYKMQEVQKCVLPKGYDRLTQKK